MEIYRQLQFWQNTAGYEAMNYQLGLARDTAVPPQRRFLSARSRSIETFASPLHSAASGQVSLIAEAPMQGSDNRQARRRPCLCTEVHVFIFRLHSLALPCQLVAI